MKTEFHRRLRGFLFFAVGAALLILLTALAWGASANRLSAFADVREVRSLPEVTYETRDGQSGTLLLPGSLAELPPRSAVTLNARVDAGEGDCLLIKTVYTRLRLYENGKLIYTCGEEGRYPAFLLDPPTILAIVPLMAGEGVRQLRFEYLSPTQRSVMSIPAVFAGDQAALAMMVFEENVLSLLFALLFILLGAAVAGMGLMLRRSLPKAVAFLWLGLFAVATGMWTFGECDLTALLLPYPSLLYVLAFGGLFTLGIPLMLYGLTVLGPRSRAPLGAASLALATAAAAAFALQLLGLVSLSRSMYVFHVLVPLAFVVFAACLVREAVCFKSRVARRFTAPILALAASAVLEVVNYSVRFTDILSLFFQAGMLIFVLSLGVISGFYARDAMRAEAEKARLEMEVTASGRLLRMQREQYDRLTEGVEAAQKARHDLRHQLTALSGYADSEDMAGIRGYLAEMLGALPPKTETPLCKNYALDAVARHYQALAERRGTQMELALRVPGDTGSVLATDLCVVAGNLLENAIEACERLERGKRLIRFGADVRGDYLIFSMGNSFDGKCLEKGGVFYSGKRGFDSEGVGIASIRAVVKKYGGYAEFTAGGTMFESAAVVRLHG